MKCDKLPHRVSGTDIVGILDGAQPHCGPGRHSAGLGWQLQWSPALQWPEARPGSWVCGVASAGKVTECWCSCDVAQASVECQSSEARWEALVKACSYFWGHVSVPCWLQTAQLWQSPSAGCPSWLQVASAGVDPAVFGFSVMLTTVFLLG